MSDDKHQAVEEDSIAPPVEQELVEPHIHAKTYLVIFVRFDCFSGQAWYIFLHLLTFPRPCL